MVVIGRSYKDYMNFFQDIRPEFQNQRYLLRDLDYKWKKDLSISRCSPFTESFLPSAFRLGKQTLGEDNDCDLTYVENDNGKRFKLDLDAIFVPPINFNLNTAPHLIPFIDIDIEDEIEDKEKEVSNEIDMQEVIVIPSEQSNRCPVAFNEVPDIDYQIDRANKRFEVLNITMIDEWNDDSKFDKTWIDYLKQKYPKVMPLDLLINDKNVRSWFHLDISKDSFNCKICSKHFKHFAIDKQYETDLTTENGFKITDDIDKNRKMIYRHYEGNAHRSVLYKLKKYKLDNLKSTFISEQQKRDIKDEESKITSRMFRTVYFEAKTNLAFDNHRRLVDLQRIHGVEMGHLYASKQGSFQILESISLQMHERLLNYLLSANKPFSILLDGSNDLTKNHYLSVLFQTLDKDDNIVVYFYRLVNLKNDETARGMMRELLWWFNHDGLTKFVQNNLVAYSSDG